MWQFLFCVITECIRIIGKTEIWNYIRNSNQIQHPEIVGKTSKMVFAIFDSFSVLFMFLTLEYSYSYSKDPFYFNEKFWKPVFGPFIALVFSEVLGGSCITAFQLIEYTPYVIRRSF